VSISVDYLKKARGTLTAESRCAVPDVHARTEFPVTALVRDQAGDAVARITVRWLLEPVGDHVNVVPAGESPT
jgi:hypothetical protein